MENTLIHVILGILLDLTAFYGILFGLTHYRHIEQVNVEAGQRMEEAITDLDPFQPSNIQISKHIELLTPYSR